MHKSVPSGSHLEFVNIEPLNPLISKCEIKVLYTGKNRNRSFISKEVANKMANSLPGTPIVGQYINSSKDFGDHGEELVIDENGASFEKNTVPYGFVPLEAKAWWANYKDYDGVEREYLMTEGYLWTGRYPECERIISQGNHQSMELDGGSMEGMWGKVEGEWSKFENEPQDYFIINDATFTALCILGEDVEPCFEGANITRTSFSLDKECFKKEMLDFMADLKDALNNKENKGGTLVENIENKEEILDTPVVEDEFADKSKKKKDEEKDAEKKEENNKEEKSSEPEKKEEADSEKPAPKKEEDSKEEPKKEEKSDDKGSDKDKEDNEEKKKKKKYCLEEVVEYQELLSKFNELQVEFNAVNEELKAIKPEHDKFKMIAMEAENKAKDEMINSFYMLSDEDKKEVIENKANFSLEDIESKLSVICVRKKVNFDLDEPSKTESNTETPITTFNVGETHSTAPAWVRAVEAVAKNRK